MDITTLIFRKKLPTRSVGEDDRVRWLGARITAASVTANST